VKEYLKARQKQRIKSTEARRLLKLSERVASLTESRNCGVLCNRGINHNSSSVSVFDIAESDSEL